MRPRRPSRILAFAAACLLAWNASALRCTAQAYQIWRRGEVADPGSLDPHKASTSTEQHILDELYEGLTVFDGHGVLRPGVASRWDVSADGLRYTFHLRPNARWSNGAAVTADDFVFSLRRLMDPKTGAPYANLLYTIRNAHAVNTGALPSADLGVSAPDPATLIIDLEHPAPSFLLQLTHMTAMPVYRPAVERWGNAFTRAGHLVGNGAFVLRSYVPDDRLVLVKNRFFHDAGAVALDREDIVPITDRAAALRRFAAGEIDSYNEVPVDQVGWIRRHLAADFKLTPSLGTLFYALDTRHRPLNDARVRQALAMTINRRFLADVIWAGTAQPDTSFVPPGIMSYGAPEHAAWTDESEFAREDQAQRLIHDAGFGPEHPLLLDIRSDQSENYTAMAVAIANMWKPLGVDASFTTRDAASHFGYLGSGEPFDVARAGWFADYPDAENFLFLAESGTTALNYAHWTDPAYDGLMHDARAEPNAARRRELLHRAERVLLAAMPYIPLLSYDAANLVSPVVKGWSANVLDHHPGRYISIVR